VKLLAEARKLLAAGDYADARAKAWKAKQLHGSYSILDLGDRPEKLIADVDVAESKQKRQGGGAETNVASNNPSQSKFSPGGPMSGSDAPPPVSMAAMTAKQRAQALLDEARTLQKQGNLPEAYAKASEARIAANVAVKGGCGFGPGEESPDLFLYALAGMAKARIESLVQVADEVVSSGSNDVDRLKKAAASLSEAKQLAVLFGLDIGPLDVKLAFVLQRQSNSVAMMPAAPGGPVPSAPGDVVAVAAQQTPESGIGLKLLDNARDEIKAGRLEQARKFAEEAFDDKYGVQRQAEMVLRSIEVEAFERNRADVNRAFMNAQDAFVRGDYRQARSTLATIDERYLTDQNKTRLREISLHAEMQPQSANAPIKVAGGPIDVKGPGMANASDLPAASPQTLQDEFALVNALNKVEFDKLSKESLVAQRTANQRAEAGDLDGAIEALRGYKANLTASGLEPDQVATLQKSVDRYEQQYQTRKAQQIFKKEQLATEQSGMTNVKQRAIQERADQAKMVQWADDAKQLMHEGKYNEAEVLYRKIQELEPDNMTAQAGIHEARIQAQEQKNNDIDHHKRAEFLEGTDGDPGPLVNMQKPAVIDPATWNHTNARKSPTYLTSEFKNPVEKKIERALSERKITVSFDNVALYNCIDSIKEYIGDGINIVPDDQAIQAAGIHMDLPVSLKVNDMPLKSALNILLKKVGLTYVIENECITITTPAYAKGNQKRMVFSVADLVIPVENERSQQVDLVKAHWKNAINNQLNNGLSNYGGAATPYAVPGGLPPGQAVSANNTLTGKPSKPEDAVDLNQTLIRLITSTIAPETWSEMGGNGTIQYYPLGLALIVNQTQDIQEQIIDLLTALRRLQDLEVAIEMKLVSVSEAFYEFMGVNFNMNIPTGNTASNIQTLTSGNFQQNGLINTFHPSTPLVSGVTPAGTLTPDLGVPISTSSFGMALPPFGGYPGTLGADGGLSLGLAFLSDIQVSLFMEAAQGDRRTNVMQAPKITVFNGQTASINVGDELYFLTQINVIQVNGQMVFQPQQNPVPYGVFMTVTPVVSADRRFVRLNLNPTLQNLVSATVPLLPVQQIVPQLLYDNLSPPQPTVFTMFFQQPSTSFITLNTTVVVPDGGTVLMGGLKTLVEGRNESGPPILSKIPYLSRLFTNVGYGRETQSLMIMVTARIIINEEEELEFLGQVPRIPR
jgi:Flp pilus assembly secretin CpaC